MGGRIGRTTGYEKWTVEYNTELREELRDAVDSLRKKGLKGISSKIVLNGLLREFLLKYKNGNRKTAMRRLRPLIKAEYEQATGLRYKEVFNEN